MDKNKPRGGKERDENEKNYYSDRHCDCVLSDDELPAVRVCLTCSYDNFCPPGAANRRRAVLC